jgi:pimeloyl-ACP methyl ester carboxylesterase
VGFQPTSFWFLLKLYENPAFRSFYNPLRSPCISCSGAINCHRAGHPDGEHWPRHYLALRGAGNRNTGDLRPRIAERWRYWAEQIGPFARNYRAIAYSRRYDYPNDNPARPGYSAVTDAEDLAAFIHALHLGKVVVIGHSYGAYAALFLALKHPELVRAMVLAEPPAIPLLGYLPGDQEKTGKALLAEIQERMVAPMREAFGRGDRDAGIGDFLAYILNDPQAWEKMPQSAREQVLRNAREWDVMMTTGTLFPGIKPAEVRKISIPVLMLSGAKSYPFLGLITEELARLLPKNQSIVFPEAGHQMWYQAPEECRKDVEEFLARNGIY